MKGKEVMECERIEGEGGPLEEGRIYIFMDAEADILGVII